MNNLINKITNDDICNFFEENDDINRVSTSEIDQIIDIYSNEDNNILVENHNDNENDESL